MGTLYPNIECAWCGAGAYCGPAGGAVCPTCRRVWNDALLEPALRRVEDPPDRPSSDLRPPSA